MTRCTFPLLLLLLMGCQTLAQLEHRLVYHPAPSRGTVASDPQEDLKLHTADGVNIHARWSPRPQAKGALIYCHGNAGNLEHFRIGRAHV